MLVQLFAQSPLNTSPTPLSPVPLSRNRFVIFDPFFEAEEADFFIYYLARGLVDLNRGFIASDRVRYLNPLNRLYRLPVRDL